MKPFGLLEIYMFLRLSLLKPAKVLFNVVCSTVTLYLETPRPSPRGTNTLKSTTHMAPGASEKIQLADSIITLTLEELKQIGHTLRDRLRHPKMQSISTDSLDLGPQGRASAGSGKAEENKAEKTAFDVKLDKFDAAAKIKVNKDVMEFTNLGLKEASDLVEKATVMLKQGLTKEEANDIIEKIKSAGTVAAMD